MLLHHEDEAPLVDRRETAIRPGHTAVALRSGVSISASSPKTFPGVTESKEPPLMNSSTSPSNLR
jgi:hypothetical protein